MVVIVTVVDVLLGHAILVLRSESDLPGIKRGVSTLATAVHVETDVVYVTNVGEVVVVIVCGSFSRACVCIRVGVVGSVGVFVCVCDSVNIRISINTHPVRPVILHPDYRLSLFVGSMVPLDVFLRVRASARVPTIAADPHSCKGRVVEFEVFAQVSSFLVGAPTFHHGC